MQIKLHGIIENYIYAYLHKWKKIIQIKIKILNNINILDDVGTLYIIMRLLAVINIIHKYNEEKLSISAFLMNK
jgi:hypothetical protein